MQAYKLKGTIDHSGHLIVTEPIKVPPGEVEVIILQPSSEGDQSVPAKELRPETSEKKFKTSVKAFQDLFENTEPVSPDFNPDQARWEVLKEKHNL